MSLDRRLLAMERKTGIVTDPGSPAAAQREAARILRDNPDLQLVTDDDCEPGEEGESVYVYIMKLRARAAGDHPRAALLTNIENHRRQESGDVPEVPVERLHHLALRAAFQARARFEMAKRFRKGNTSP